MEFELDKCEKANFKRRNLISSVNIIFVVDTVVKECNQEDTSIRVRVIMKTELN